MNQPLNDIKIVEILLVEDSETDVDLMLEVMEESKLSNNLNVVMDGVAAIEYLKQQGDYQNAVRPDIILLDLNLPKKDGREVLEEIKDDDNLKGIPVVVLTSSKAEEDIYKSYKLHANCYVTKPFDLDQFAYIVRQIESFWFSVVKLPSKN
ncbi:MAG: response regulator [Alphaproteobacteria bacterium]|nr:response regulator [Rhodospirillales bacterium]MCW9046427.1 response regulator [Alphaproteobacteria bacterium]